MNHTASDPYYTLLVRFDSYDQWSPDFGDWDKQTVLDEADTYGYCEDGVETLVICTDASQRNIDDAVRRLNAEVAA